MKNPFNLISIKELAEIQGVSAATIRRWIKDKKLPAPAVIMGRAACWYKPSLTRWIATQAAKAQGVAR